MYPNEFFGLYPPFPRNDEVFVAISFDSGFDERWHNVLVPALSDSSICGVPLRPYRVDLSKAGDSILTDILSRIASSRFIVADISVIGWLADRPIRNANVLYEIGLAHSARLPEEVLIFRSDSETLDFDVRNVRIHRYDPDSDPAGAIATVIGVARDGQSELDLRRSLAVARAVEQLDAVSLALLMDAVGNGIRISREPSEGHIGGSIPTMAAIRRLLDLGAIKTEYAPMTMLTFNTEFYSPMETKLVFKATELGVKICFGALDRLGMEDPIVARMMMMVLDADAERTKHRSDAG